MTRWKVPHSFPAPLPLFFVFISTSSAQRKSRSLVRSSVTSNPKQSIFHHGTCGKHTQAQRKQAAARRGREAERRIISRRTLARFRLGVRLPVRWLTRWHPVGWSMRSASGRLAVVRLIPSVASPAAPPCASSAAATLVRSLVRSHACSFARSQLTRDFSLVRVFRRWNPDALGQQVRVSQ